VSEARIIGRQGSIQNTFELRSIHTAKKIFYRSDLSDREVDCDLGVEKLYIKTMTLSVIVFIHPMV
jgi:hypothetical protein